MKFIKEPINFEQENWGYLVIGYFNGKAIVKDESYRLYFIRCEEQAAPIGTVVSGNLAKSIEKLNSVEQEQIQGIYGDKEL